MTGYSGPIQGVCEGIFDGPHATPRESEEGPIFLGIGNVTSDGRLDLSEIRHVSEQEFPIWTRRVTPQPDDVVFSYEATLHRYARIPENFRGCLGRRMALVRVDKTKVDPRFLLYYFLSPQWRRVIEGNVISGATVDRIPIKRFPSFPVSIPRLEQQRDIADALDAYDSLIENNRRRIRLFEEAARLLYQEWFVRLDFPGHEHANSVGGIPAGWRRGRVCDFYDTASGGTPSRKMPKYFEPEIPWVKTQELANSFIVETDEGISEEALKYSAARLFPCRTVLIAMYGATVGELGILAMPGACNQACCAVLPRDEAAHFIHAFLFFRESKERLRSLSAGSAQPNISQEVIRAFPMIFPAKTVLKSFIEILSPTFDLWLNLQNQNRQLMRARDLLLPRLMSGEVEV